MYNHVHGHMYNHVHGHMYNHVHSHMVKSITMAFEKINTKTRVYVTDKSKLVRINTCSQ